MLQFEQNKNQLHGILIKNTDMQYELKNEITQKLSEFIQKTESSKSKQNEICKLLTLYLQKKYQGAWITIIGRKFTANVMHEPGFFLRASTENYHITVFKLRVIETKEIQSQQTKRVHRPSMQLDSIFLKPKRTNSMRDSINQENL